MHDETAAGTLQGSSAKRFGLLSAEWKTLASGTIHTDKQATFRHDVTNNALTDFRLAGNPATNTARLKAMAHGGPLVIAHDHWLSAMMPDAFTDASEGGKTVCMADIDRW